MQDLTLYWHVNIKEKRFSDIHGAVAIFPPKSEKILFLMVHYIQICQGSFSFTLLKLSQFFWTACNCTSFCCDKKNIRNMKCSHRQHLLLAPCEEFRPRRHPENAVVWKEESRPCVFGSYEVFYAVNFTAEDPVFQT